MEDDDVEDDNVDDFDADDVDVDNSGVDEHIAENITGTKCIYLIKGKQLNMANNTTADVSDQSIRQSISLFANCAADSIKQ